MEIISLLLPVVYMVVGAALVWFVVELALTMRQVRSTVKTKVDPTLSKVDPLVDRVTLTVDSVNLELMRVDTILEDVSHITDGVSKTVNAVDTVTSAPIDIVTNVTKKVRSKLRPKYASDESVDLGSEQRAPEQENPFVEFVDVAGSAAAETVRTEAQRIAADVKDAK